MTVDVESGYGQDNETIVNNVLEIVNVGASGINIEDSLKHATGLKETKKQGALLKAIRYQLDSHGYSKYFRTDKIHCRCHILII